MQTSSNRTGVHRFGLGLTLAAATVAGVTVGSGTAHAASSPQVVGKKYSDASSSLSQAGYSVVIATTFGDEVSRPDCIVVNQHDRTVPAPENSSGSATNQTLVSLNCDAPVASAKSAGNSLASPEGRAAAAAEASAAAQPPSSP